MNPAGKLQIEYLTFTFFSWWLVSVKILLLIMIMMMMMMMTMMMIYPALVTFEGPGPSYPRQAISVEQRNKFDHSPGKGRNLWSEAGKYWKLWKIYESKLMCVCVWPVPTCTHNAWQREVGQWRAYCCVPWCWRPPTRRPKGQIFLSGEKVEPWFAHIFFFNSSCATVTTPWYYARQSDRGRVQSFRPRPFTPCLRRPFVTICLVVSSGCCFYLNDPIDRTLPERMEFHGFFYQSEMLSRISSLHAVLLTFWAPFLFADVVAPVPLHAAFSESAVCRSVRKNLKGFGRSHAQQGF